MNLILGALKFKGHFNSPGGQIKRGQFADNCGDNSAGVILNRRKHRMVAISF